MSWWASEPWGNSGRKDYLPSQFSQFSRSVMSDSASPWTAAHQASLSITNSRSPPKSMSVESVMPSNHLILCRPLLLLPSSSHQTAATPYGEPQGSSGCEKHRMKVKVLVTQLCLFEIPCTVAHQTPLSMNCPGKNTGVGSQSLLQGIIPTQGSNSGIPHCS